MSQATGTGSDAVNVSGEGRTYGVIAEFAGPGQLLRAARAVRDAGYRKFDVYTPYPVHGMDSAMGLGRSKLGWIVLACAMAGICTGMGLQWYANVYEYPLMTGGKPYFSWQAFIVVTFELTILFSAFGAVFGMLALNGLPMWYHPTLKHDVFANVTDDGFYLAIEAADPKFEVQKVKDLLDRTGGLGVTVLEE